MHSRFLQWLLFTLESSTKGLLIESLMKGQHVLIVCSSVDNSREEDGILEAIDAEQVLVQQQHSNVGEVPTSYQQQCGDAFGNPHRHLLNSRVDRCR